MCNVVRPTSCMIDLPTQIVSIRADQAGCTESPSLEAHDIIGRGAESIRVIRA